MLQSYCPNSVIILLSFLWLPSVLQPSKQTLAYEVTATDLASSEVFNGLQLFKRIVIKSALHKLPQLLLFFPNFSYSTVQKICTVFFVLCSPKNSTKFHQKILSKRSRILLSQTKFRCHILAKSYGVHLRTKIIENKGQFEVQKLDYPCRNLVI